MSKDIFQASLQDGEAGSTKSYDIRKFFYVAFFGGIIATLILALKNAKWLKAGDKVLKIIFIAGCAALLIKVVISGNALNWIASIESLSPAGIKQAKWVLRGVSVGFYLFIYYLLKDKFHQHMVTIGDTEPLLKDSIFLIAIGGIIETIIIFGGVFVIGFFI